MLDSIDLYRRIKIDLIDMGIPLERAASWAYEAIEAVIAGGSIPAIDKLEEQAS